MPLSVTPTTPRVFEHMSTARPTIICLTPLKNEAWILDRFLQCASTWADHILLADQHSTDGTREIARRYEKVRLLDNENEEYDEGARQRLLINAAREIPTKTHRLFLALDADEVLSANWMESSEWNGLLSARPGTVLRFQWANVAPGVQTGWIDPDVKPFGFVDDGSPHEGKPIHSPRVPVPRNAPSLDLEEIRVLHYQYANWERMKSKQRWYQCWERLKYPDKRPVTIYRQYHRMDPSLKNAEPLRPEWLRGYEEQGIDMRSIDAEPVYHWDAEVLDLLRTHGPAPFRRLDIWDCDWRDVGRTLGCDLNGEGVDPRSSFEKRVHDWLSDTQGRSQNLSVRAVQKLLQLGGW